MSWKVKLVPTNYLAANYFKSFVLLRVIDMSCTRCSFVWNNIIRKNIQFLNHFEDLRDEQILALKGKFTVDIKVLSCLTLIWGGPPPLSVLGLECLAGQLCEYNFCLHVASDIAIDSYYLHPHSFNPISHGGGLLWPRTFSNTYNTA